MKVGFTIQSGKLILVEGWKEWIKLKVGDGDGPNLCRVKKYKLVPHLLKIYFGLGQED